MIEITAIIQSGIQCTYNFEEQKLSPHAQIWDNSKVHLQISATVHLPHLTTRGITKLWCIIKATCKLRNLFWGLKSQKPYATKTLKETQLCVCPRLSYIPSYNHELHVWCVLSNSSPYIHSEYSGAAVEYWGQGRHECWHHHSKHQTYIW